ncbi:MAG: hypothetical protein V8S86_05640 [Eubacteriales bacterium]
MKIRTLHLIPLLLLLCAALSGCGQRLQAAPFSFSPEDVPPFSGEPYAVLQDNQPGFSQEDFTTDSFETYSSRICLAGAAPPMPTSVWTRCPRRNGTASAKSSPAAGRR